MKEWRLAKNDSLTILWTAANAKDATNGDISKYTEAFEEKKLFLLKEKKRVAIYRQKLKAKCSQNNAAASRKKRRLDLAVKDRNAINQQTGKIKKWKQNQRNETRFSDIKVRLFSGENIDGKWMKYHKSPITPFGFCIKASNLSGVEALLVMKASSVIEINSSGSKPLDEAA